MADMNLVERRALAMSVVPRLAKGIASLTATLMLTACAQTADLLPKPAMTVAQDSDDDKDRSSIPQNELQKATTYWGQEHAKRPTELEPALNYARNLKALGEKQKALAILQRTGSMHDGDRTLAGEYGRLALELDQIAVAQRMLEIADDPAKPDWKVISARGTVLSKQGQYKAAVPFYERALALSNNQASVLNNLAMAHAMSGDAKKAEELLRQAQAHPGANTAKVNQNLALVLGLQGRYDEAKLLTSGSSSASADASQNVDTLRKFVKVDAKPAFNAPPQSAVAQGAVTDFKTQVTRAIATAPQPKPVATAAPLLKPATTDAAAIDDSWKLNVSANAPAPLRGATR